MRALFIFAMLRAVSADPAPNAQAQTILLLRFGADAGSEGERLRGQVAVYMRDLGIEVQAIAIPEPPTAIGAAAAAAAAAALRERGARLAFWCDPAAVDGTITLHVVDAS